MQSTKENSNRWSVAIDFGALKSQWINPRKKRFWLIVGLILYTLNGFFLVPYLVKNAIIDQSQLRLGRVVSIDRVAFNPYVLDLTIEGFELLDTDDVPIASVATFYVNFQLASLFQWALVFREIRFDSPYFLFERFTLEDSRLERLLAHAASDEPQTEDFALPPLLIMDLIVNEGRLEGIDHVPDKVVKLDLTPINISIQELNTLPDRIGEQSVFIKLHNNATLKWNGSLDLSPLVSEGDLVLENFHLNVISPYVKAQLPIDSIDANLSSRFHYKLDMSQELSLDIDNISVEISDISVTGLQPVTNFATIAKVLVSDGSMHYPQRSLSVGQLSIDNPEITVWQSSNGVMSLEQLLATQTSADEQTSDPWQLKLDKFNLNSGQINLTDHTLSPAAVFEVTDLQLQLTGISDQDNVVMPLNMTMMIAGDGHLSMDAELTVMPDLTISGTSQIRKLPLKLVQPYVQQVLHAAIEGGVVNSDLTFSMLPNQELQVSGGIQIPLFELTDTLSQEKTLAWNTFVIDDFELDLNGPKLQVSKLTLDEPYARIVINQDQSTNLSHMLVQHSDEADAAGLTTPESTSAGEESAREFDLIIGGTFVKNGFLNMSDLSLPLHFSTLITHLDGTISTIDTQSTTPPNVKLEGQVDEFGLARIQGKMDVMDPIRQTDITLEFKNLLLSNLSPYSASFAGREIAEGKLELSLRYVINEGLLDGSNNVVLSDLLLGKKIDHPDAGSLPLGLAIALLTDANGVIDIDLPVEGDVNDPTFRVGGVIWKAFTGLLTKIVTSPFRLLAGLVGVDSDDFGQLEFLAGRSDLTPPEIEKIEKLAQALHERPDLSIEINGAYDPHIDGPAIKQQRLHKAVFAKLGENALLDDGTTTMLDEQLRDFVEILFIERHPDFVLDELRASHTKPPVDDPEGKAVFDQLSYAVDLKDRLLAAETVTEQDFDELSIARANSIKLAFGSILATDRVVVLQESLIVTSEDKEWIILELAVAAGE